ncbi:MAG: bacteriohopanetetrol glucosamine biosynthesis glycosyltransferase HpnI [Caulobacteraceae bacterium]|nr:bacteriohopanetetrol glucosamine biosynthesis glycosyltransferase HpnI [Caulobacter sp.]
MHAQAEEHAIVHMPWQETPGWLAAALAAAGVGYTLASERVLNAMTPPPPPAFGAGEAPDVTVLKPLHGLEPELEADLRSFIEQDYPGRFRLRLGLQSAGDAALPLAQRLAAEHPGRVDVVLDDKGHGANRKVSNLINLAANAEGDVFVLSDSDMRVAPDYLRRVVGALSAPGVGAVTCYYAGRAARPTLPARLAAMGISYGFLPQVALAVRIDAAKPCMGSTIAVTRAVLNEIGGLQAVADVLADDYEIGRRVRALGRTVALPPMVLGHGCDEPRFADLWRHELRWNRTIRGLDPWGYLGSIITYPLALALLALALDAPFGAAAATPALGIAAAALAARLWLKRRVDKLVGARTGPWWLTPARDLLSFAVFLAAAPARRVDWRGARFHVGRDGELSPV